MIAPVVLNVIHIAVVFAGASFLGLRGKDALSPRVIEQQTVVADDGHALAFRGVDDRRADLGVVRHDDENVEPLFVAAPLRRFGREVRAHSEYWPATAACACDALMPGRSRAMGTTQS